MSAQLDALPATSVDLAKIEVVVLRLNVVVATEFPPREPVVAVEIAIVQPESE